MRVWLMIFSRWFLEVCHMLPIQSVRNRRTQIPETCVEHVYKHIQGEPSEHARFQHGTITLFFFLDFDR